MNRKILALLFTVVLTCTAGAAQACGMNRFDAPAIGVLAATNNPVLPPVAEQTNGVIASSIASWTHKIKTFLDTRIIQENCLATAVTTGTNNSATGPTVTVTLANNGGNCALANSANGAFTFATKVASGGAYAITASPPTGKVCTITRGSGTASSPSTPISSSPTPCAACAPG